MIPSMEGKRVAPYAGNTIKSKPPVALVVCTYFKIVNYPPPVKGHRFQYNVILHDTLVKQVPRTKMKLNFLIAIR